MKEKTIKKLRITSFILTMVMLVLFSVGTILMDLRDMKKDATGLVQYRTSGGVAELKKFEITTPTIKEGEKLKIDVDATTDESLGIEYYALWAKDKSTGEIFYSSFDGPNLGENAQTADGENTATPGTYTVTGLTAAIINGNDRVYHFIDAENCDGEFDCKNSKLIQGKTFTITPAQVVESPFYEYVMSFEKQQKSVSIGDRIECRISRVDKNDEINMVRRDLKTMMLSFTNKDDGNVVNMYVKSLVGSPYIIIPSTATPGEYNLDYAYLTFTDGTSERYKNTPTKTFSYETKFTVAEKEFDTSKYVFANELYDSIKNDLTKLDDDAIITIDANKMPLIREEVFKNIKGTKRTLIIDYDASEWIFSGTDIKNPKTIDVSTLVSKLENSNEYYDNFLKTNVTSPSAMLKFSNNGELPGKVLIKIDSNSIDEYLKNPDKAYVYYYKEDSDQLMKVAMEIQKNNGFYEFYINHNSKYIISSKEVKSDVVSDNLDMLALNGQIQQSAQLPMLYILATACGVLSMLLLIVILVKGKKQTTQA